MKTQRTVFRALFLSVTLLVPALAFGQQDRPSQEYVVGTVGGWSRIGGTPVGAAFGYERIFGSGMGLGLEAEGFGGRGYGGMLFSGDVAYHLRDATLSQRVVPFLTGGYSGAVVCASCVGMSGINFGFGVNYWTSSSRGLRIEFRDHAFFSRGPTHKAEIRFGIAF